MRLEYIIHNGIDYGNLPQHSIDIELKQDETPEHGYTDLNVKLPSEFIVDNKFRVGDIVSFITRKGDKFFLFVDYRICFVKGSVVKATSKDYVDFQPMIALGAQI